MDFVYLSNLAGFAGFILWALNERTFTLSVQQQHKGEKKELGSYWLVSLCWYGTIGFSLLDAWNLELSLFKQPLLVLRVLGMMLIMSGLAARYLSRKALGTQYSVFVETSSEHRLVTDGIYRKVRHPAYLGLLCLFVGIPLCEGSWGGLLIAVLLGLPALMYRIKIEESALAEWFGEEFLTYSRNTRRLIPFIW